jgi:hypothetical protein
VKQQVSVDINAPVEHVFPLVADLGRYPQLLDVVHQVEPEPAGTGYGPATESADPAWLVTLRTQIGPLARSKRLRMVRTEHEPLSRAHFERQELDGRQHAPWTLTATVEPLDDEGGETTRVTMALHYGGRLWTSRLDGVLEAQIRQATDNLERLALAQG